MSVEWYEIETKRNEEKHDEYKITEEQPSTPCPEREETLQRFCYTCKNKLGKRFLLDRREKMSGIVTAKLYCSIECRNKNRNGKM